MYTLTPGAHTRQCVERYFSLYSVHSARKENGMPTGSKNKRSTTKGIRFPHELIEEINASVAQQKVDACNRKLVTPKRDKPVKS